MGAPDGRAGRLSGSSPERSLSSHRSVAPGVLAPAAARLRPWRLVAGVVVFAGVLLVALLGAILGPSGRAASAPGPVSARPPATEMAHLLSSPAELPTDGSGTLQATVIVADPSEAATTGPVLYSVNVSGDPSSLTPSGEVTLSDQLGASCSLTLDSSGNGSCGIVEDAVDSPFTVTAVYGGDDNFAPASGDNSADPEPVAPATPTMSVTGPTGATTGAVVYSVALTGPGSLEPSGSVDLSDGAGGACTVASLDDAGNGSCTIVEGAADSPFSVKATYGGDGNYAGATARTTEDVDQATPTVALNAPSDPTTGPVRYTVSVTGAETVVPTGVVALTDSAGGRCTVPALDDSGNGSCTIVEDAADSPLTVTATYGSDSNYNAASTDVTESIGLGTPTVIVTAPKGATTGSVDYSVSVSGTGNVVPSGTVLISDGTGRTCPIESLDASGAGDCSITEGAADSPLSVTAAYGGDDNYAATTGTASEPVAPATPAIEVTGPPALLAFEGTITLNVTVAGTGPTPAGLLTISDELPQPGTCSRLVASTIDPTVGQGSCEITVDTPSVVAVTVTVASDGNYVQSSASTTLSVNATATKLQKRFSTLTFGQEWREIFTVTVTAPASPPPAPVTVEAGSVTLCTVTSLAEDLPQSPHSYSGVCSPPATALAPGTSAVVAVFAGTSKLLGSSSPRQSPLVVNRASSSTKLAASRSPVIYGSEQLERLQATVSAARGDPAPTGPVTVTSARRTLCLIRLRAGTGSCVLVPRALAPGKRPLVASYGGSIDYTASSSAAVTLTVQRAASVTSLDLSSPRVSAPREGSEVLSVSVAAPRGLPLATGGGAVYAGSRRLCSFQLTKGEARCSLTVTLRPGNYELRATYQGSAWLLPSTSAVAKLTIL